MNEPIPCVCGKRGRTCQAPTHPRRKLTPKMNAALRETFGSEVGISYCTDRELTARSGIIEEWMIKVGTSVALIDRGMLTPVKVVAVSDTGLTFERQQITAAGCEAIGRSMAEIVEWAWREAMRDRAEAGHTGEIMLKLPVGVGAVVGWTHKGEAIIGTVYRIGVSHATIKSGDGSAWSVSLDEIERVIELPCPNGHVAAPRTAAGTCAEVEQPAETPRRSLARDYPAVEGRVVMQMHADYCAQYGHAQHTSNGVDTGLCPRCGDPIINFGAEPIAPVHADGSVCDPYEDHDHDPITPELAAAVGITPACVEPTTGKADALLQADLFTGRADRKALPIVPATKPEAKPLDVDALWLEVVVPVLEATNREAMAERPAGGNASTVEYRRASLAFWQRLMDRTKRQHEAWSAYVDALIGKGAPAVVLYLAGGERDRMQDRMQEWSHPLEAAREALAVAEKQESSR